MLSATPMEARSEVALPSGEGWWYEPKWDGFRCIAFREGGEVLLQAKSGKPPTRYFPEVANMLSALPVDRFAIDGELLVADGKHFSFDALQTRLHPPASRIKRLAGETPAVFTLFDMLMTPDGADLRKAMLRERRIALTRFAERYGGPHLLVSPGTSERPWRPLG